MFFQKGGNLLMTKDGVVKLADFGACTYTALNKNLTVVGTPFWMAPEIIEMRFDQFIFSFFFLIQRTVMALELLQIFGLWDVQFWNCWQVKRKGKKQSSPKIFSSKGAPPYFHLGTMQALFKMVEDPHPPIPACSPECKDFLLQCFVKVQQERKRKRI